MLKMIKFENREITMKQKIKEIREKKLSAEGNIKKFINKIKNENDSLNIVLHINNQAIIQAKEVDKKIKNNNAGKLAGLGFLVKSNINVKGLICNCASKTLENYKAGYNATVIQKLLDEDAIVLGMVNCDEFACGSTGENSAFGLCKNPNAMKRVPGGSSSGSGAGVAAGFCDFALGSDTGGSVRAPASCCGIVGYKPSYGAVSRYGLVDMCMSFDQIGPLGLKVEDCNLVFDIIKGKDERDPATIEFKNEKKDLKKVKIGILKINSDKEIWDLVKKRINEVCLKQGWKAEDVELDYVELGIESYYPIVYTEFFSGTRKFDGRKFGYKIEDVCGEEVLRRILGGQEITKAEYGGQYYRKALIARKLIQREFEKAFKKYDCLISPTFPKLSPKVGEKISFEDIYDYDACTVLANLCEIPAISIPAGTIKQEDGDIPVGMQLLGWKGEDSNLLEIAKVF
jgi:aspartyl-tRNA(Asn)/glutamyl-tRNA(Gln) amidotransferase subunit A